MSEIRVTSVVGENGGDRVGLTTGLTVGPLTGTTGIGATITHQGHAQFAGVCTATSFVGNVTGNVTTDKIIPTGGVPTGGGGGIIQVKQTVLDTVFSSNNTNYVDVTGMSVSITPKFNTSKILVMVTLRCAMNQSDRWSAYILLRDSQILFDGTADGSRTQCSMWHIPFVGTGTGNTFGDKNITFLDSPASTSALTYKLQVKVQSGATAYVNRSMNDSNADYGPRTSSSITVMEVSA